MLDDFSAFDSVCMSSTIEKKVERMKVKKKRKKQKSHPLTHKQTLIKSSLCIMNVDDDDEVFSITERERDPARVFENTTRRRIRVCVLDETYYRQMHRKRIQK